MLVQASDKLTRFGLIVGRPAWDMPPSREIVPAGVAGRFGVRGDD
jgi:hypothetical protein